MANDFSTIKDNLSIEKINLVRIETAREIGASLVLSSGTTFTFTFHVAAVKKIVVDGVTFTEVSSSPAANQFIYVESTKLITINLGAAYVAQQVVVFYYLFYSKDESRIAPETPTDSSSTDRVWESRLKRFPNTKVDSKDIQDGTLQFSSSAIVLHNQDGDFEQYLTDLDSFANKEIVLWAALDDVENVALFFKGNITKLTVGNEVTIEYDDNLALLTQTYFSNGSYLSSTFNTSKFPNMDRSKENEPIRKLFCEITTYSVVEEDVTDLLYKVPSKSLLEAVCTDFDDEITTSNNRKWGTVLGVSITSGAQFDNVVAADHSAGGYSLITYGTGKNYRIGDTLQIDNTKFVRVKFVDTAAKQFRCTKDATISGGDDIVREGISCIVINQGGADFHIQYIRDYTISFSTNDVLLVTFTNNFEATVGMATLNPNEDIVGFRAWSDETRTIIHGDVIKEVLEDLNFTVNAASITAANLTVLNTNFYVPNIGDSSFPTFGNIVESILRSTLSYLTINNSLEIEYALLEAPSPAATATRDEDDILKDSVEFTLDYTNVYNAITPINKHDIIELDYSNLGLESNKARFLHETKRNREFVHVLESPDRLQQVINLISERKMQYLYKIKSKDLDSIVGDDFQLSGITLPGNVNTKDVKILEINKKLSEILIISNDLLGL